jgi:arylsulfatase A-like enzyme/plastocyanin
VIAIAMVAWSLTAIAGTPAPPSAKAGARPNIVLIIADDMRDDQLAAMPITGRELVDRGVTFTNAFASRPLCCPSRVSILRGQYAHTTGIYTNTAPSGGYVAFRDHGLESSTLATWLDGVGYRTALVGKYLNEYGPGNAVVPPGWDHWVAIDETNAAYYGYDLNVDGSIVPFASAPEDYSTDVLTGYADSFIRDTPADIPLFLYLSYSAPHEPYRPGPRHETDPACANATTAERPSFNEADVSDKPAEIRNLPLLSASDQTRFGTTLPVNQCRALLSVDDGVGVVIDALADSGRLNDTLIVFLSDNGLFLGEHRLPDSKSRTYEEAVNVPFIVRYDAVPSAAGTVDDRIVANIDLAPTVTDLAGLDIRPGCPSPEPATCTGEFDGRSLLPLLDGSATRWRSGILLEGPSWCGIRTARYNYTRYGSGFEELYDLTLDPYQLENALFGTVTPDEQALRDTLLAELRVLCSPTPPNFSFPPAPVPTLSSFTPTSGAPGDTVSITGSDFAGATAVTFDGSEAAFTVVSSTSIDATVPQGATSGPISVTTPSGTATSPTSFTVAAPRIEIRVLDDAFSPTPAVVPQGSRARWSFEGSRTHSVVDASLLGAQETPMFDSGPRDPGARFSYAFVAAGRYPYRSDQGESPAMVGFIRVPVVVAPETGTSSTAFAVRWATSTMAGRDYEVQVRFRRAGKLTPGPWRSFAGPTRNLSKAFTPDRGAGKYQFRARVRNVGTGRTSAWSGVSGISVS